MKTRIDTNKTPKRKNRRGPKGKILTLKERVLAIKAYHRKPVYSKVAKKFKCNWQQIKAIIQERKAILDYYEMATAHHTTLNIEELFIRRQKLVSLGACMFEYIQRAQYNHNALLDDKVLIAQAAEFSYLMRIKNFIPTKPWLKQFKISYQIPLSAQQIRLTRSPPASLNSKNIIAFCKGLSDSKTEKKNGKSENTEADNTLTSTKSNSKAYTTPLESAWRLQRRLKINLLEKALYEFIQRAQYHRNALLNEDLHIKVAYELNDMLQIESFTPNKNWIKHFKLHFNISTSQRVIVVNRIPPSSLDLNDILSYCREMEQQNSQPKMILNSGVQPNTIVTLEFHNVDEVDIKPDMTDIEFEILEDDEEMEQPVLKIQKVESMYVDKSIPEQPTHSFDHCSDEEDIKFKILEDDVEVEQPALQIQKIESMHVDKTIPGQPTNSFDHCSDEEDIKPDITDIKLEILEDDVEVGQPALKIQEIKSTHQVETVDITSEQSANSSGQGPHETSDADVLSKHANVDSNQTIKQTHSIAENDEKNILTIEDRVRIIAAYDNKMTFFRIAKYFNCKREEVKNIIRNRRNIMKSYNILTSIANTRRQKIALLGECMFEYIQREHFHANAYPDDDTLIDMANKFSECLIIQNFTANKRWLNRFKVTYTLPLYQRRNELKRTSPASLNPRVIIAYCRRQQTDKQKKCQVEQSMTTKSSTTELMKTLAYSTPEYKIRVLRQHQIDTMEKALYEYIQRSQYHKKMPLIEGLQINVACELAKILKIDNFVPNKGWLKHFKLHYNINTSQRMIVVNRIPPSSLDLNDILSYCGYTCNRCELTSTKTVTVEHDDKQEEDIRPHLQLEEQEESEQQIDINLEVQPETLENQNIESFQIEKSSGNEVLPKLTKSYADALKKLKSLEEFSLLEENYRAIGLITELENIFKNPP